MQSPAGNFDKAFQFLAANDRLLGFFRALGFVVTTSPNPPGGLWRTMRPDDSRLEATLPHALRLLSALCHLSPFDDRRTLASGFDSSQRQTLQVATRPVLNFALGGWLPGSSKRQCSLLLLSRNLRFNDHPHFWNEKCLKTGLHGAINTCQWHPFPAKQYGSAQREEQKEGKHLLEPKHQVCTTCCSLLYQITDCMGRLVPEGDAFS